MVGAAAPRDVGAARALMFYDGPMIGSSRSSGQVVVLGQLPLRVAALQERRDTLARVGLTAGPREQLALPGKHRRPVDVVDRAAPDELGDRRRHRRHVGRDVVGHLDRRRQHLLGRQRPDRQPQLDRLGAAGTRGPVSNRSIDRA